MRDVRPDSCCGWESDRHDRLCSNGAEGHLRGVAVSPEWQGSGVATALLRAAENELRTNGCTFVTLDTTAPLKRATRFYEKHGFSASGRVSDFFGMPLYEYAKPLSDSRRAGQKRRIS